MKKILLIFMALLTFGFTARAADGDEFTIDNLTYKVISEESHKAAITGFNFQKGLPVDFQIPSIVKNGSSRYFVTEIGERAFLLGIEAQWITIPTSVTKIGKEAFYGCGGLKSITIPNSVTEIGQGAFFRCDNMSSVTIPTSITEIGTGVFEKCSSLNSVVIPNSVTKIGSYAFSECSSLSSVTIPNSVTEIGSYAFSECSSLSSVTIPNSVTEIGSYAFYSCDLISVTVPNSVTKIGGCAFRGNEQLNEILVENGNSNYTSVNGVLYNIDLTELLAYPGGGKETFEIPNSVTIIGFGAFSDCHNLTSVTIPNSVTDIDGSAFHRCSNLMSITIPNSVTQIGSYAFRSCSKLTSITIPNSVTQIGSYAFRDCSNLESTILSSSMTYISESMFSNCSNLRSVTIPNSVTTIGNDTFLNCKSLKTIYVLSTTPPTIINPYGSTFQSVSIETVVYIPKGTLNTYFVADCWDYFTDFREMGAFDVALSESTISIEQGKTTILTATATKDEEVNIESETWVTSNPGVATVDDNGVVTAIAAGTASIICTVVDSYGCPHTESCEVTVTENSGVEDIEADGSNTPAEYYNINGVRVNGDVLSPGIYIKRQGGKATKVLVK